MTRDSFTNLPAARALLFGRAADCTLLADRLLATPGRLLIVTGPGGVGKTSLALAVARHVAPTFAHGAWVADLAALTLPNAVPAAIAGAVGVREGHDVPVWDAVRTFLRGRRVLLLLDNCEHLLDACAAAANDLLDRCPDLRILATSREPLRIAGEVTYPLQPLPVPSTTTATNPNALRTCASVELFLDRARAVRPDFTLTPSNAQTVAAICSQVDGIPLALELAATRLRGLTLNQIAERLHDSFAVLIGSGRAQPARHQTLRATLEWSHALLNPVEQTVFRRLGAFAAGWSLPAAQAVCASPSEEGAAAAVAEAVAGLVEKSLVVLEEHDGDARYRFLEPVREYAQGCLAAAAEWDQSRDRHCAFFVRFAEQAGPEIHRAEQAVWLRRLDRDFENLRLAVRTAQARGDAESVLRLTGALWWYLWMRGHLREGVGWLEPALGRDDVSEPARLAGLGAAAMLLGALGRSDESATLAGELLHRARRLGNHTDAARAATLLGMEWFRRGDLDQTLPLFEQALAAARAAAHPMLVGNALVNLGQVLRQRGEADRAEAFYRQGLAHFEREADVWGIAYAANNLAALLLHQGKHEQATRLSAEAVRLLTGLGDRFYLIFAVEDLGRVVAAGGRSASAARLFGAGHALRLATGALLPPGGQADYEHDLAAVRGVVGDAGFARAWAEGEQRPFETLGDETTAQVQAPAPAAAAELRGPNGVLTQREVEVVRLLGQGCSNRQIAAALVVTVGTAGVHVEHILRKLDLQSRHQVAEWARARGLEPG